MLIPHSELKSDFGDLKWIFETQEAFFAFFMENLTRFSDPAPKFRVPYRELCSKDGSNLSQRKFKKNWSCPRK